MNQKRLAEYISVALGPHVWLLVVSLLVLLQSGLSHEQVSIVVPSVVALQVVLPLSYLLVAPKMGWTKHWDMRERNERYPLFVLMIIATIASLLVVYFFGNTFLFQMGTLFLVLLLALAAISLFWKISLHASLNTLGALTINYLYDWRFPVLFLAIVVVFWARIKLKRHTFAQLVAGTAVTAVVLLGGFYLVALSH